MDAVKNEYFRFLDAKVSETQAAAAALVQDGREDESRALKAKATICEVCCVFRLRSISSAETAVSVSVSTLNCEKRSPFVKSFPFAGFLTVCIPVAYTSFEKVSGKMSLTSLTISVTFKETAPRRMLFPIVLGGKV